MLGIAGPDRRVCERMSCKRKLQAPSISQHFFLPFLPWNPNRLPSSASLGIKQAVWASGEQDLRRPSKTWANLVGFPVICKIAFQREKQPGRWKAAGGFGNSLQVNTCDLFFLKIGIYSSVNCFLAQRRRGIKPTFSKRTKPLIRSTTGWF